MSRMYRENRKTINWFVGCRHDCVYCKPSFQAQMKRQKHRCPKCYRYEPHTHLERLLKPPPKTMDKEFIFFPSSGDPTFASMIEWATALEYARKYTETTFLIQSKDPSCFIGINFPENVILATTIETNPLSFNIKGCKYEYYSDISHAPYPMQRLSDLLKVTHKRKATTIEPILLFGSKLPSYIKLLNPKFVYVGYDNHNCKLPEPPLAKTQLLIKELRKFTTVRVKTLRKAWYEA